MFNPIDDEYKAYARGYNDGIMAGIEMAYGVLKKHLPDFLDNTTENLKLMVSSPVEKTM